ncbi:AMP-dependent synthetase/ligase [Penicillium griseofulvum]|uniref:AMP-dependent synthetase/ligase n=1 Tax=Penicillium patulum TaxID=5078 RepID=A0A135M0J2_PENPA|nr:AMP-dependent synthetase/ligase [Penicillium griseofulvum]KXG54739.1 AMP-dependent synthetase/ligase [Penicillium griseofulvum]
MMTTSYPMSFTTLSLMGGLSTSCARSWPSSTRLLDEVNTHSSAQLEYWKQELEGSSPAELLTDRPRPKVLTGEASAVPFTIEAELYQSLQAFCKTHQMTPFVVLLAAFRATHYRLTGAEDACIGTPIANRNRPELENMIGFFVNTQCMRITVEDDTFEGLTQKVRSTATAAFANQDVPFERIVSTLLAGSRDTSRNPLVQLLLAVHSQKDMGRIQLEGMQAEPIGLSVTTRFDIEFHLFQESDRLSGGMAFSTQLFEADTITHLLAVFRETLRRGLEDPQTPIATMQLTDGLGELRTKGHLQIDRTEYPRESSVVDIFREQVAAFPDAIAVKDSSSQLTYAELDRQSDQLAAWLQQRRLPAESLVAVLSPRCCQTITAFLGILKANLAYLPFDVNVPTARTEAILSTLVGPRLVFLGPDVCPPALELSDLEMVRIGDALAHPCQDIPSDTNTPLWPSATSLAYVLFTSGSTGKPKGVMIESQAIIRLVKQSNVANVLPPAPCVAHLSSITFDISAWEIYAPLLNGGTLVCIDYPTALNSEALAFVFARERICAAMLPPALVKQYLADTPGAFRLLDVLFVAGDRFDSQDAIDAQALVKGGVYNSYGQTENSVLSTIYKILENEQFVNGVPIGHAVSNSGAYIMDPRQQLVPPGVMGELVVTGDGLARGYTDPALDKDRFIDVIIDGQEVRAYRTGDRARYRPKDCQIEFFGRMDRQIKIRGHRIELAEVEHAILGQESVRDAAVVATKQDDEELEMIAFHAKPPPDLAPLVHGAGPDCGAGATTCQSQWEG